jgi:hypothetical protein
MSTGQGYDLGVWGHGGLNILIFGASVVALSDRAER